MPRPFNGIDHIREVSRPAVLHRGSASTSRTAAGRRREFFDLYNAADIPLPPDFAARPTVPAGFPEVSVPQRNGDLFINRDATPDEAREMIRAVLGQRLVDGLERRPRARCLGSV